MALPFLYVLLSPSAALAKILDRRVLIGNDREPFFDMVTPLVPATSSPSLLGDAA